MEKTIQKYGDSLVIRIDPQDIKFYDLKEGDRVELILKKISIEKNSNV